MSRDSQEGEESGSQRTKDDPRRRRNEGAPNWYDKAVNENYQEEVMQIPKDKVGLVIGRQGRTIKDIKARSGVQKLFVKQGQVHLRGTGEQRTNAKTIIDMVLRGEDSPDQGSWKKLDFIPEKYMGGVIGKNRQNLNDIEQKTGATLRVFERNTLCIKGSIESQKRAIREIKELVNRLMKGQSERFVHVDTTQLDLNEEFQLSIVGPPNICNPGETNRYELQKLQHRSEDVEDCSSGFIDMHRLKDKFLRVLKNIHREKEEEMVNVVIWCHLGHTYINKVSEADEDEDYFTVAEIKEKLEEKKSWKPSFEGGIEDIEIERIEKHLESRAAKEDIRYDFTFYTPSHRDVRVKVWLTRKDAEQGGDDSTSMVFSRSAPIHVKNILTHALSDELGDSSNTPCFYLCSQYQERMKADILMVSKTFDYRLLIRTCRSYAPKTPEAEEEDRILESYLMGMKIEGDQLVLPPVSERPDGFDLFFQRRSLRRTYQHKTEGEQFSLTVCKDQGKTVDPVESNASDVIKTTTKTDIHLHCEEWDQVLDEGNWEPEQIVSKLPTFLQFLREVQRNVAP